MVFETKLFRNVNKIFYTLKERILVVQNSFPLALFALFLGFLCGNLFGTFLDTLRIYFIWNGFVVFIILLFIEMINFFVYRISLTEKINTNLPLTFNKTRGFIDKVYRFIDFVDRFFSALQDFCFARGTDVDAVRNPEKDNILSKGDVSKVSLGRVTPKGSGYNIKVKVLRKGRDVHFTGISETIYIERSMNAFKIGLLFGFFIDSFKVGS